MLVLIAVGLAAGVITALSPCVLPVLPIVLAGGATGGGRSRSSPASSAASRSSRSRAAWLLDLLGLPDDLLRDLAIVLLVLVAVTMLWPALGRVDLAPARLPRAAPAGELGGGVLLGASLGLVFVPCAGPVLAAVTVLAAAERRRRPSGRPHARLRDRRGDPAARGRHRSAAAPPTRCGRARRRCGSPPEALLLVAARWRSPSASTRTLQTRVPGYTQALQDRIERSAAAPSAG